MASAISKERTVKKSMFIERLTLTIPSLGEIHLAEAGSYGKYAVTTAMYSQ